MPVITRSMAKAQAASKLVKVSRKDDSVLHDFLNKHAKVPSRPTVENTIIANIRALLEPFQQTLTVMQRIEASDRLMTYISDPIILAFVKSKKRLAQTVIEKCYYLKREVLFHTQVRIVVPTCDKILEALGAPLVQALEVEKMTVDGLKQLAGQIQKLIERRA